MDKKNLVIFGLGEIAELAKYYFENDSDYRVIAFCVDDDYLDKENHMGLPVISLSKLKVMYPPENYEVHIALSYNKLNEVRKIKYLILKDMGYTLANYICSKSVFWSDLKIGDNCFILENQTIQPTVKIGNNVMIWSGNHLGHGCEIKDHAYLSSHICISGHTIIGEKCFIGVNSTFKDFITVGDDVFIAMGASIAKDVPSGSVVLASQSTYLNREDKLAIKLKSKYFNL